MASSDQMAKILNRLRAIASDPEKGNFGWKPSAPTRRERKPKDRIFFDFGEAKSEEDGCLGRGGFRKLLQNRPRIMTFQNSTSSCPLIVRE